MSRVLADSKPGFNLEDLGPPPAAQPRVYPWERATKDRYLVKDSATYTDTERRFPPDKFGCEAEDDARVWRMYKSGATAKEEDRVGKLRKTIDSLPVFTAFNIEGNKQLQPDFAEFQIKAFFAVHRANNSGFTGLDNSFHPDSFQASNGARWANGPGLWLGSLALSLFVALHAIIAQQWLEDYSLRITEPSATHRSWVWRHVVFSAGFERWKVDAFISALPLALHLSLLLFFTGLVLFFQPIDPVASFVMAGAAAAGLTFYVMLTFLPLIRRDCPTSTPLLRLALLAFRLFTPKFQCLVGTGCLTGASGKRQPKTDEDLLVNERDPFDLDLHALLWMVKYLPAVDDVNAAIDAFGSLQPPTHPDVRPFSENEFDGYSTMQYVVNQRLRMLEAGIGTDAVAIARVLRSSIALSALCQRSIAHVHEPTFVQWASTMRQYDVYWLCFILLGIGPASLRETSAQEVVDWCQDDTAAPDRPYTAATFKLITDWHIPRRFQRPTIHGIVRSMLYVETYFEGNPTQLDERSFNRRLLLWLLRDAEGEPIITPDSQPISEDTSGTLAQLMVLYDSLITTGRDYRSPLFEQCVKVAVVEPLQLSSTRDRLIVMQLVRFGSRSATPLSNSRLIDQVLRLLAFTFRHGFTSHDSWPGDVAPLLRITFGGVNLKATKELLRRSAELLPHLTASTHCTVRDIGESLVNYPIIGLLSSSSTLPSTWRLILAVQIGAWNLLSFVRVGPTSILRLAREILAVITQSSIPSRRLLRELLGDADDTEPLSVLTHCLSDGELVDVLSHARYLDHKWWLRVSDLLRGNPHAVGLSTWPAMVLIEQVERSQPCSVCHRASGRHPNPQRNTGQAGSLSDVGLQPSVSLTHLADEEWSDTESASSLQSHVATSSDEPNDVRLATPNAGDVGPDNSPENDDTASSP